MIFISTIFKLMPLKKSHTMNLKTENSLSNLKKLNIYLQVLGFLFFGILFVLAWALYKERMLNYDPAFFSFRIIYDKNYDVELGRWGSIISQILPLWFLKSGCSLETFLRV